MIIDLILDRKADEEDIANGYTHVKMPNGEIKSLEYNPREFYYYIRRYESELDDDRISYAMDYGTEEDVKQALCDYIYDYDYNPEICNFINSVNWLE